MQLNGAEILFVEWEDCRPDISLLVSNKVKECFEFSELNLIRVIDRHMKHLGASLILRTSALD